MMFSKRVEISRGVVTAEEQSLIYKENGAEIQVSYFHPDFEYLVDLLSIWILNEKPRQIEWKQNPLMKVLMKWVTSQFN